MDFRSKLVTGTVLALLLNVAATAAPLEAIDGLSIKLDPSLRNKQVKALKKSFETLRRLQSDSLLHGMYGEFFGTTFADAVSYIDKNIDFIVAQDFMIAKSLKVKTPVSIRSSSNGRGGIFGKKDKAVLLAVNPSTTYSALVEGIADAEKSLQGAALMLSFKQSSDLPSYVPWKTNFMKLQKGFTGKGISDFSRVAALIHESRHSDCETKFRPDRKLPLKERMAAMDGRCGHMHAACPEGHPLAGIAACDNEKGFGAYFYGAVFATAVARTCANCSEADQVEAMMVAFESLGRVVNLDEFMEERPSMLRISPTKRAFF